MSCSTGCNQLFGGALPLSNVTVGVKSNKDIPHKVGKLHESSFFDAASLAYLNNKYKDKVCTNMFWLKWNADRKALDIPRDSLRRCILSGKRFVFQPVELRSSVGGSHANVIIIDIAKKTAERFEPQGHRAETGFADFRYSSLDARLRAYFNFGITYLSANEICPYMGPQSVEDSTGVSGYCAAWSLWYADMRLANENIEARPLIEGMVAKALALSRSGQLKEYLRRYLSQAYGYMYKTFPQYSDFFTNYDKYVEMRNPPPGFEQFLRQMNYLVTPKPSEQEVYVGYTTPTNRRPNSAYPKKQPYKRRRAIGDETQWEEAIFEPSSATPQYHVQTSNEDERTMEEFEKFYNKVLHVVMRN